MSALGFGLIFHAFSLKGFVEEEKVQRARSSEIEMSFCSMMIKVIYKFRQTVTKSRVKNTTVNSTPAMSIARETSACNLNAPVLSTTLSAFSGGS